MLSHSVEKGMTRVLYAFGSNGSGQLGLGPGVGDPNAPQEVPLPSSISTPPSDVVHFAAGGNHTIIGHDNGSMFSSGHNEDGRCGESPSAADANAVFRPVTSTLKIRQVAATWSASAIVDMDGRTVRTVGSGSSGELGLGLGIRQASEWQRTASFCSADLEIVQLATCMAHTVAVLSNGDVYGWGKGRRGQIGLPAEDVWSPRKIDGIPFAVTQAVCGKDFTCFFGSPERGELLIYGVGKNDRSGIRTNAPKAVPGRKQVAASWGSIFVLKDDGELIGWGRDDHGQLPPPGLPPIKMIAAGSEHCLALTETGKVLAWGWGEHGNCGEPTDANGDVKVRWNCIEVPHTVDRIFAGCATTFIATPKTG